MQIEIAHIVYVGHHSWVDMAGLCSIGITPAGPAVVAPPPLRPVSGVDHHPVGRGGRQ